MENVTYNEFCKLVLEASGPFSYRFAGLGNMTCYPVLYKARNGASHLHANARKVSA